jgi:anti-sigma factor RsiW
MTDEQLSALLRVKRYEQPPAQYFDRLLQDVHRRQRTELLQRPLWKIAAERVQTFFSEHSMGHLSYAGALASVLVVGVATIGLITPGGSIERTSPSQNVAVNSPADSEKLLSLQASQPLPLQSPSLQTAQSGLGTVGQKPRYVIDARPVSYEPSFNF